MPSKLGVPETNHKDRHNHAAFMQHLVRKWGLGRLAHGRWTGESLSSSKEESAIKMLTMQQYSRDDFSPRKTDRFRADARSSSDSPRVFKLLKISGRCELLNKSCYVRMLKVSAAKLERVLRRLK